MLASQPSLKILRVLSWPSFQEDCYDRTSLRLNEQRFHQCMDNFAQRMFGDRPASSWRGKLKLLCFGEQVLNHDSCSNQISIINANCCLVDPKCYLVKECRDVPHRRDLAPIARKSVIGEVPECYGWWDITELHLGSGTQHLQEDTLEEKAKSIELELQNTGAAGSRSAAWKRRFLRVARRAPRLVSRRTA